jgi:hypothetical protein
LVALNLSKFLHSLLKLPKKRASRVCRPHNTSAAPPTPFAMNGFGSGGGSQAGGSGRPPAGSPNRAIDHPLRDGTSSKKLIKDQLEIAECKGPNGEIKKEVRLRALTARLLPPCSSPPPPPPPLPPPPPPPHPPIPPASALFRANLRHLYLTSEEEDVRRRLLLILLPLPRATSV